MAGEPNTSVDQIFDALDVLAETQESVGVAEMSRELGLSTSTAHRLLVTLQDAGFARRDTTGTKYEIGTGAYRLVHNLFGQYPIQHVALAWLDCLVNEFGETGGLDVRVGWASVRMGGIEGWHEIHAETKVGLTQPLGHTASGLVMLAYSPREEVERYLEWEGDGRRNAGRTRDLRRTLAQILEDRFAHVFPNEIGGGHLAFPIRCQGRPVAAISIDCAGPPRDPTEAEVAWCYKIVGIIEAVLDNDPSQARDPFAHLAPSELTRLLGVQPPA